MRRKALIREHWPSVPGHGEEYKAYTVRVLEEYANHIVAKPHWYSRRKVYAKRGMFVRVDDIKEEHKL